MSLLKLLWDLEQWKKRKINQRRDLTLFIRLSANNRSWTKTNEDAYRREVIV